VRLFADLYAAIDETNRTSGKVEALAAYFRAVEPLEAAWAVYFLIGRRPRQVVPTKLLRQWAREESGIPEWLLAECYDAVGDLSETIALILPPPLRTNDEGLPAWVHRLLSIRNAGEAMQRAVMLDAWQSFDARQRFVWNKLITGSFRVGVSGQLVTRALARATGVEATTIAHRLMGDWEPSASWYAALGSPDATVEEVSRPYPFCLAYPLEDELASLGPRDEWQVEWKWDGIRAQLLRRRGQTFLWSRGEELITERFPEIAAMGDALPDGTVLDGEVMPWRDGRPLPFAQLQRRIGRKTLTRAILAEVPVAFLAFDLLEHEGRDLRAEPLSERRRHLEALVRGVEPAGRLMPSPVLSEPDWDALAVAWRRSREQQAEGFMLKRKSSAYRVGRQRGDWWKWKVEPFTMDAVLTAAQRGNGKRASLYTDYTFSVWSDGKLVPVAKAYSGLTDAEIRRVDSFVRKHMLEKFGPVRTVKPELVFELAFEGIQRSPRHKSGVAVRFPRILRWRDDKSAEDADSLDTLRALIAASEAGRSEVIPES
jgi:DNA ligase-1